MRDEGACRVDVWEADVFILQVSITGCYNGQSS
jgi:hypothetical protein